MGWKLWKSKKESNMEKVHEGDPKIKDHILQELSGLKFQPIAGGKSSKVVDVKEKNGKQTIVFENGTTADFKFLDDKYLKLSLSQKDLTGDQIQRVLAARQIPKKSNEKGETTGKIDGTEGLSEKELIKRSLADAKGEVDKVTIKTSESPLEELLKKQKENFVSLNLELEVNLPPKALFSILLESYDNAEEEILNFAVSRVDIGLIKKAIKKAIKTNFYKIDGKQERTTDTKSSGGGKDPIPN